jgi:uncharacterized protein
MAFPLRISLGAPGIYRTPDSPLHALTGVRMDVAAFVGVAPRGPVRVPVVNEKWRSDRPCVEDDRPRRRTVAVPIESFDDYRKLFGSFEGPGLLPYSVAAFFEQGGRRAYIARVVHDYGDPAANAAAEAASVAQGIVAAGTLTRPLKLRARSEGGWGNRLRAALEYSVRPIDAPAENLASLFVDASIDLPIGALVRLTALDGSRVLRLITDITAEPLQNRAAVRHRATFDQPLPIQFDPPHEKLAFVEVVSGSLTIDDGDGRSERHDHLGFSSLHPRWIATVLCYESQLVYPHKDWSNAEVVPSDPNLPEAGWSAPFEGGEDRYEEITHDDFFDVWTLSDEEPGNGIFALTQLSDLSVVVVPDLYSPAPLVDDDKVLDPVSHAGPEFAPCVTTELEEEEQTPREFELKNLRLDPRLPADREKIIDLQSNLLTKFADLLRSFVVLLDVPPGLNQRQILDWRSRFNSAFGAAYYPWLQIVRRDDQRDALIRVPPSAVAAGIIARQEFAFGVPHGPANVLAEQVVGLDDQVSPARHDDLHPQGINIYLRERDGVRLTAARTLSRDPSFRQLSVRRLLTMIERALERQMQWVVFEPNNAALRGEVRVVLTNYLRQLFRLGAFRGATEAEAFFVRCDETNNPAYLTDAGRLVAEIGIAPAEPLEFIVLQLVRGSDGTLTLQE